MIKQFLDVILPGDIELKLPSATSIGIDKALSDLRIQTEVDEFFKLLRVVADKKYQEKLKDLSENQYLKVIESTKRKDMQLVNLIVQTCLTHYYSNQAVLELLNVGASPAFPSGNYLPEDDWMLLESVFERGPIYKELP